MQWLWNLGERPSDLDGKGLQRLVEVHRQSRGEGREHWS